MRLLTVGLMKSEVATSCSKIGLLMEGEGHQPTNKSFEPTSIGCTHQYEFQIVYQDLPHREI